MEDYRLYGMDANEERFASRSERHLDKPVKPRKPFVQRLCIFVAVVVGIALALAVAVVVWVLIMYFGQGGFHSEPILSTAEATASKATFVARYPVSAT